MPAPPIPVELGYAWLAGATTMHGLCVRLRQLAERPDLPEGYARGLRDAADAMLYVMSKIPPRGAGVVALRRAV